MDDRELAQRVRLTPTPQPRQQPQQQQRQPRSQMPHLSQEDLVRELVDRRYSQLVKDGWIREQPSVAWSQESTGAPTQPPRSWDEMGRPERFDAEIRLGRALGLGHTSEYDIRAEILKMLLGGGR
jgi:hypothetical protein